MKIKLLKKSLIIAMLLISFIANAQWIQIGNDIDGDTIGDWLGHSVSSSADGSLVAIGAPASVNGISAGYVRVYKDSSGSWVQVGSDIDGEAVDDWSGEFVSLSSDGLVVAIGATQNAANGVDAGHVRIYRDSSGTWVQVGSDIDGEAAINYSGVSISLNKNGSMVAIGAYLNDGNGQWSGHVRVYENIAGSWIQVGSDIDGEAADDWSGASVSLSSDSAIVAIGAPKNGGNGTNAGHVRIYKYISGTWTQIGNDIDGEAADDWSGGSVSLNAGGSVVAIGAVGSDDNGSMSGHARIYENIGGVWTQIGADIDGEAADDRAGHFVSLNYDGSVVAIGSPYNDGNGIDAGHVRVYKNISGTWTQVGNDIDGEAAGDESGWSVSLSSDGLSVAIGADGNNGNGIQAGHVRMYTYNNNIGFNEVNNTVTASIYPNPTSGKITVECEGMERVEVLDVGGKVVYKLAVSSDVHDIDISGFSRGVYFVKVTNAVGVDVRKIVLE